MVEKRPRETETQDQPTAKRQKSEQAAPVSALLITHWKLYRDILSSISRIQSGENIPSEVVFSHFVRDVNDAVYGEGQSADTIGEGQSTDTVSFLGATVEKRAFKPQFDWGEGQVKNAKKKELELYLQAMGQSLSEKEKQELKHASIPQLTNMVEKAKQDYKNHLKLQLEHAPKNKPIIPGG